MLGLIQLSGCGLDDNGGYRFPSVPGNLALNVDFTDKLAGPDIGGLVTITRAAYDSEEATSYVIRWGYYDVAAALPDGKSNFIARIPITDDNTSPQLVYDLATHRPPEGVNSLVVYTANALGESYAGRHVLIENFYADERAPKTRPLGISFGDNDSRLPINGSGNVRTYTNGTPLPRDVKYYSIRYAGNDGCPLTGPRVASVNYSDYPSYLTFSIPRQWPPAEAASLIAIPANDFGEAYQEDCSQYVRTSSFNYIQETDWPSLPPRRVLISADADPTEKLSVTISVEPNDEREIRNGYYVSWFFRATAVGGQILEYCQTYLPGSRNETLGFISKTSPLENGYRKITFNNLVVPAGAIGMVVSPGSPCGQRNTNWASVNFNNVIGPWYQIRLAQPSALNNANECLASANINDLVVETCDASRHTQRFHVRNVPVSGNDDFFEIRNDINGFCMYRSDDSGATENWSLQPCDGSRNQQMELKAFSAESKNRKKIAVRKDVLGVTWWICAWHPTWSNTITGSWGNCGATQHDISWHFAPGGTTNPDYFALFNDTWQ